MPACRYICAILTMQAATGWAVARVMSIRTTIRVITIRRRYAPDDARGMPYYEPGELGGEERVRAYRKYRAQLDEMYKTHKKR